jgi:shikimate dehydrogenase
VFQQAALDHLGISAKFESWPTPPEELEPRVASFREDDCLGSCVTLPHKQAVIQLIDELAETAASVGAVNWIINRDGRLTGHNTDSPGFLRAIKEREGVEPAGADALIFGAGGAARAIVHALKSAGVARLTIANRTVANAERLAADFTEARFRPTAIGMSRDELANVAPFATLIVNTTSIGMAGGPAPDRSPLTADMISADALCYDAVYAPPVTPFLEEAERAGARTAGGLTMLVYQGVVGFELLTGKPAPVDVMFEAVDRARKGG